MKSNPTLSRKGPTIWPRLLLGAIGLVAAIFVYTTIQQETFTTKHGLVVTKAENPAAYYYSLVFVSVFAGVHLYFAIRPAKKK